MFQEVNTAWGKMWKCSEASRTEDSVWLKYEFVGAGLIADNHISRVCDA